MAACRCRTPASRTSSPGIINLNTGLPVPVGAALPASGQLTNMTVGQFMQIYDQQIAALQAQLAPTNLNDLSVRNIQLGKTATDLYPHEYPVQHALHMSLGVQRELPGNSVLSVEFVRRRFDDTLLGSLDLNRFNRFVNGVQSPVIRQCATAAERNDPERAVLERGDHLLDAGRQRDLQRRCSPSSTSASRTGISFGVSYALTDRTGIDGISNLDNYFANEGPIGARHVLNISAMFDLPGNIQIGFISAFSSKSPVMPTVTNVDLDGDGTTTTPIPGVDYNCFNRGCDEAIWERRSTPSTHSYAGRRDARGQVIAPQLRCRRSSSSATTSARRTCA